MQARTATCSNTKCVYRRRVWSLMRHVVSRRLAIDNIIKATLYGAPDVWLFRKPKKSEACETEGDIILQLVTQCISSPLMTTMGADTFIRAI